MHETLIDSGGSSNMSRSSTTVRAVSTACENTRPEDQDTISTHPSVERPEDLEGRTPPRYTLNDDPFNLAAKIKTPHELLAIRANTSRKRDGFGPITFNKEAKKARKIQKYYEKQNDNIRRMLKPVDHHVQTAREIRGANQLKVKIAIHGSFIANVLLAALQLYAAISSVSLSLFTTMADALFDPLSNITLIVSNRAIGKVDSRKFPSGKARIETAGNIVFCFLMTSVSFILIVVSVMELVNGAPGGADRKTFHLPSVIAVGVAFCTKLALFIYCWSLRKSYSQIHILWEDHRNDLFINGFGLLTSVGGSKLVWWLDPMGAILLAILISFLWLHTAYNEFQLLIGVTADTEMLQWITYIAMTHSPTIQAIDTVRAYHSGPRLIAEVDVVMDAQESVAVAHDVAETLQMKLESLPDMERCYVHIDYETSHKPEHFLKKEL